jgi:hypothetical protein
MDASPRAVYMSADAPHGALNSALDASPLRLVRAELHAAIIEMRAWAESPPEQHRTGEQDWTGEEDRKVEGGDAGGGTFGSAAGSAFDALSSLLLKHNALLGREMARTVCLDAEACGLRRRLRDAEAAAVRHEAERHVAISQLRMMQKQVRAPAAEAGGRD